jgi:hypothetical protein
MYLCIRRGAVIIEYEEKEMISRVYYIHTILCLQIVRGYGRNPARPDPMNHLCEYKEYIYYIQRTTQACDTSASYLFPTYSTNTAG